MILAFIKALPRSKDREKFLEVFSQETDGAEGDLGHDGLDGRRAKEANETILNEIESRTGIRFR